MTNTATLEPFVIFDLEANSDRADVTQHKIIEIGAVKVLGWAEVDSFQALVRPGRPLIPEVLGLTGLTETSLRSARQIGDVLPDFLAFVGHMPLLAHNGYSYDFPLLDARCQAAGLQVPSGTRLDTLDLAHIAFPRVGTEVLISVDGNESPKSRRLEDLCHYFGISKNPQRHRALDDARLTLSLVTELIRLVNQDSEKRRLQRWVLGEGRHPWAAHLNSAPEKPSLEDLIPVPDVGDRPAATGTFDVDAAIAPLRENGVLLGPDRVYRPQQVR